MEPVEPWEAEADASDAVAGCPGVFCGGRLCNGGFCDGGFCNGGFWDGMVVSSNDISWTIATT